MRIVLLMLCFTMLTAVSLQAQKVDYNPYINVGTTLSSGHLSYSLEEGVYSEKVWVALAVSTFEDAADVMQWYGSGKAYYRVGHQGVIDTYLWNGVNVHIAADRAISIEPGVAVVINGRKIAPQVSLSFPIGENTEHVWKPLQMNLGLSLNLWLK